MLLWMEQSRKTFINNIFTLTLTCFQAGPLFLATMLLDVLMKFWMSAWLLFIFFVLSRTETTSLMSLGYNSSLAVASSVCLMIELTLADKNPPSNLSSWNDERTKQCKGLQVMTIFNWLNILIYHCNRYFPNLLQCPRKNGLKSRLAVRSQCYLSYPASIPSRCSYLLKQIWEVSIGYCRSYYPMIEYNYTFEINQRNHPYEDINAYSIRSCKWQKKLNIFCRAVILLQT